MEGHLRTELVVDALRMAVWRRKPAPGLVHHSDQGVQCTALSFSERLREVGIKPSMGRIGSALDNGLSGGHGVLAPPRVDFESVASGAQPDEPR